MSPFCQGHGFCFSWRCSPKHYSSNKSAHVGVAKYPLWKQYLRRPLFDYGILFVHAFTGTSVEGKRFAALDFSRRGRYPISMPDSSHRNRRYCLHQYQDQHPFDGCGHGHSRHPPVSRYLYLYRDRPIYPHVPKYALL